MKISDVIQPDQNHTDLVVSSKSQLLQALARKAGAALGLPEKAILEPLAAREKLGSTGIGSGIAIPHTRVPGVVRPFGMLARLAKPIPFEAIDDVPVDIVFVLLMPDQGGKDHLNVLSAVARRLRTSGVVERLRAATDAEDIYRVLTGEG